MTTVRRRGTGGGGVEAKNEFKIENAGEPKQPLAKITATTAEWSKSLNAGEAASAVLTLESTSNTTKGKIALGTKGVWQEETIAVSPGKGATAPRLGVGTAAPLAFCEVEPGTAGKPEEVTTATAIAASKTLFVKGAVGGNTSITTTGTGGVGSEVKIESGLGGEAPAAATSSTGGAGGSLVIQSAPGGAPGLITATTTKGGAGGSLTMATGKGGEGEAATTGTGGKGGTLNIATGVGGAAKTTGGEGGSIKAEAGKGGTGSTTGGAGGFITFSAGSGGATNAAGGAVTFIAGASSGTGKGGTMEFAAGKGNEAEKGGTIIFRTESAGVGSNERLKITPSGAAEFQKGIGVWGHIAPAAQHGEIKEAVAFEKGTEGFKTEAQAKEIHDKLNELIALVKETGLSL